MLNTYQVAYLNKVFPRGFKFEKEEACQKTVQPKAPPSKQKSSKSRNKVTRELTLSVRETRGEFQSGL